MPSLDVAEKNFIAGIRPNPEDDVKQAIRSLIRASENLSMYLREREKTVDDAPTYPDELFNEIRRDAQRTAQNTAEAWESFAARTKFILIKFESLNR